MLQRGAYSRFTFCSTRAKVATMPSYKNESARMAPAAEPLPEDIQHAIDAIMRGRPPLALFTTLARDRRLFFKFFNSGLLDRGHLTIRQREIVIQQSLQQFLKSLRSHGVGPSAFSASLPRPGRRCAN